MLAHASSIHAPDRFHLRGENLALTPRGYRGVVRLWMASPSHRAVMLNPRFRWGGVSKTTGGWRGLPATVWVMHVGRR